MEIWKPIVGFVDYEVSSFGRIRSITPRKGARSKVNEGILSGWIQKVTSTYVRRLVAFRKNKKTHFMKVHRLVLTAFKGDCPQDMEALHIDGDSLNNHIDNLRWGTHMENIQDTIKHGRKSPPPIHSGETHPKATLTTEQVNYIRSLNFTRGTQAKLAREFSVAAITINRIKLGITRKDG